MSPALLVIISGPPAAGKTSLGQRIAKELHLPFLQKDEFKELLSNSLDVLGADWSLKLGRASRNLTDSLLEKLLSNGVSLIVEGNFTPQSDNLLFQQLVAKYNIRVVQILCKAEGRRLFIRFRQRRKSRHPIHLEHYIGCAPFKEVLMRGELPSLDLKGTAVVVDTTDFRYINESRLLALVRSEII